MNERSPTSGHAARRLRSMIDPFGYLLTEAFHLVGLFAIGAATVWAAFHAFLGMVARGEARLEDLLLLFIYLEIGSMVGIYFRTNHLPVRFLIYVGITALTRHMIVFVQSAGAPDFGVLILAGGTLIMSLAVLVVRYASFPFSLRAPRRGRRRGVTAFVTSGGAAGRRPMMSHRSAEFPPFMSPSPSSAAALPPPLRLRSRGLCS